MVAVEHAGVSVTSRECSVEGCTASTIPGGRKCSQHYRLARVEQPKPIIESKRCRSCGEMKSVSAFLRRSDSPDGYRHKCEECRRGDAQRCSFPGCPNRLKRGGLCDAHAKQRDRGSELSPLGSRQGGLNRGDAEESRAELLALGFEPSVPFPGSQVPWPGVCLKCGRPGAPTLRNVRHVGSSPCAYCVTYTFRLDEPGAFYAVASSSIIKCGIANSLAARLRSHRRQGLVEVLTLLEFDRGARAVELEEEWLAFVRSVPEEYRVTKADLRDGWTEAVRRHSQAEEFVRSIAERN